MINYTESAIFAVASISWKNNIGNINMTDNKHFIKLTEQIRLSHSNALKKYMQLCKRYKQFIKRFDDEEVKKYFHIIDMFFYDETGKIDWNNINLLMPPDIENSIKREYKLLNEKEVKLCCLLLFDISVNDIAEILPYTQKSIHSITHRIKQKTVIEDIKLNLKKMLWNEKIE